MKHVAESKQPDSVVCLAFTPDAKKLVIGDAGGTVRVFEKAETRTPLLKSTLAAHKDGPVWSAVFSPDGKRLATGGRDQTVKLWDMTKPKPTAIPLSGHEDGVRGVAFDPDGKNLFSIGGDDEQLRAWDLSGEKPKAGEVVKLGGRVTGLAVSPNVGLIATSGAKGASRLTTLKDGKFGDATPLETGGKSVVSVAFAPDGASLAGISVHSETEDRVVVWGIDGKPIQEFKFDLHLHAIGFAPDGRHLIVVTERNTLVVRLPK